MQTPPSTGLLRGWTFRIFLLVAAFAGFIGTAADTHHRLQVSTYGIPATIKLASRYQTPPTSWYHHEGSPRASFLVKISPDNGSELTSELYLPKEIVEALLRGESRRIVFADGNPRRFILQGDPLPPFGVGWLVFGVVFLGLFLYSLRLR